MIFPVRVVDVGLYKITSGSYPYTYDMILVSCVRGDEICEISVPESNSGQNAGSACINAFLDSKCVVAGTQKDVIV